MIAASLRAAHVSRWQTIGRLENLLALSGNNSLKQKAVCIRAQLCKLIEEIIVCWNAVGLEFFRGAVRQVRLNHSLPFAANAGWFDLARRRRKNFHSAAEGVCSREHLPFASSVMVTDQQAYGFANRPIWRASALLAAAFFIFGGARAEAGSPPGEVVAVAPGGIVDRQPVDPTPMRRQARTESSLRGNPLWAVPLEALTDTRARPIFSPSRRPPAPAVVASPPPPPTPKPPPPREPERLQLTLLGTVIGASERIGVFLDETTKEVIRIRTGASHDGWTLSSVHRSAASFAKNRQETTLKFPSPGSEQPASGVAVVASKAGGVGVSGNRGAVNPAENHARAAGLTIPASAPAAPSIHKVRQEIRQDILSIGVQN